MSISFDRNRAQVYYERLIGVVSPEELLQKHADFKAHILSDSEATQMRIELNQDAVDFFFNGIVSFSEGIDAVFLKRFSWATVKLYYAIYYLLRATLAVNGYAILRCKNMHRLIARAGETPIATGNKKYNTTHEGTISHYRDIFSRSDKLLSNKIEDFDAYEWMMNVREIVNYRSSAFLEPDCLEIWDNYAQSVDNGSLSTMLSTLEKDSYIMCFQEEYAVVAIPIKCMQQTINQMGVNGLLGSFEEVRTQYAKSVIGYDNRSLSILNQVFNTN